MWCPPSGFIFTSIRSPLSSPSRSLHREHSVVVVAVSLFTCESHISDYLVSTWDSIHFFRESKYSIFVSRRYDTTMDSSVVHKTKSYNKRRLKRSSFHYRICPRVYIFTQDHNLLSMKNSSVQTVHFLLKGRCLIFLSAIYQLFIKYFYIK